MCLDRGVLIRQEDGRTEECVAVRGHDKRKVAQPAEPHFVVAHDLLDVREGDLALGGAITLIVSQPSLNILALLLGKPFLQPPLSAIPPVVSNFIQGGGGEETEQKHTASSGKLGNKNTNPTATTQVNTPSSIKIHLHP